MIKAKVNGKSIEIETSYDELSFGKLLQLVEAQSDSAKQVAVLIGEPVEVVRKAQILGLENIYQAISFLKVPVVIDEFPVKVGEYKLPKDLAFESVEQFEVLKQEIGKAGETKDLVEMTRALAMYAAIYCQPLNEPFDAEKAGYLAKQFESYPCREVMSAGSFFMAKLLSIQSGLSMSYLRKDIPMRKNRQVSRNLMKRLGSMRLLTVWRVMWAHLTKKS